MFALMSPCFALGVLEGARAASTGPVDGAAVADAPDPRNDHELRRIIPARMASRVSHRATRDHGG